MSSAAAWLMLVVAGLLDVGWAIAMTLAEGYTRPGWSIVSLVLLAAFVVLLGRALTAGGRRRLCRVDRHRGSRHVIMGVVLFGEGLSAMKLAGIALVLSGILALKLA